MEVRGRAHFKQHPVVPDRAGQLAAGHDLAFAPDGVLHDAYTMPDALGVAASVGPPDTLGSRRLPGVERQPEARFAGQTAFGEVLIGRMACFGARQIEPHDPGVKKRDGRPDNRVRGALVAKSVDEDAERDAGLAARPVHAVDDGFDDGLQAEPRTGVERRGEANLGVHHVLRRVVEEALVCDSAEGLRRLHDCHRLVESREIFDERAGFALMKPLGESVLRGCRKACVSGGVGELEDRADAEAAVEVVVEYGLGKGPDEFALHSGSLGESSIAAETHRTWTRCTLLRMEGLEETPSRRAGFFAATHGMPPWVPRLLAQITGIVVLLWAAYHVGRALRGFLILLLISLFLSTALEPGASFLEKRGWRRGVATGVMFILGVQAVLLVVGLMLPLVIDQTQKLIDSVPGYIDQVSGLLADYDIEVSTEELVDAVTNIDASVPSLAGGVGGTLLGFGSAVVGTVFQLLTIGLFTFYLTADAPRIRRAVLRLFPQERQRMLLRIQEIAVEKTGGYIYSRALLALMSGLTAWIVFRIIGVPFAEPLALWVGILSQFVPVVGTYLGGVLPVIIALLESPVMAFWVVVFIILYQQFENYVIAPRVTAHTMSLHPAVAFGSAIVGATLLGVAGALMALPVAATIQAWVSTYIERYELVSPEAGAAPAGTTPAGTAPDEASRRIGGAALPPISP